MNQATNLIQFGLLTEEQQKEFKREDKHLYEYFASYAQTNKLVWRDVRHSPFPQRHQTYRLKILPDEWYVIEHEPTGIEETIQGSKVGPVKDMDVLRPAKPEIPKPDLIDLIKDKYKDFDVVKLFWWRENSTEFLRIPIRQTECYNHTDCQSMKGFHKYVYQHNGAFITRNGPTYEVGGKTAFPVAALFERGE